MSLIERMSPTPRMTADCWPIDGIAANIDVAVAQGLQNLRQREPIGDKLVAVDLNFEGFGLAAPTGDIDDPRHRAKPPRDHQSCSVFRSITL
jgi:hypothetical protein